MVFLTQLNIYTDGASRSNPGKSASGYSLLDADNNVLMKKSFYNGIKTNNEAEYLAIIAALLAASENYGYDVDIDLYSDSRLVVSQINGDFKVKNEGLKKMHAEAAGLVGKFRICRLHNVPRENEYISRVDADLNLLLDKY